MLVSGAVTDRFLNARLPGSVWNELSNSGRNGYRRCFLPTNQPTNQPTGRKSPMMDPKMTMEVPEQVREFGEKSIDQVEKAISTFMESANKSVAAVPSPMTDVAKQALAITEANLMA